MKKLNKKLGQVFTPDFIVDKMIDLITFPNPSVLEPSSGDGSFYNKLISTYEDVTGIEIDPNVAHPNAIIGSFFNHTEKHDVIIGNPPYVDFKNLSPQDLPSNSKLYHKPNLYMYFIEKSLDLLNKNGELIFITPVEWLYSSSFKTISKKIFDNFSIQYFEIVKEDVWSGASVTTCIFKLKKGNHPRLKYFISPSQKIFFGDDYVVPSVVGIKVGAVSGNNTRYKRDVPTSVDFVVSSTERDKKLVPMWMDDSWVRKVPFPPNDWTYQIFVNTKTRNKKPFYFLEDQKQSSLINFEGSVLSIFVDCTYEKVLEIVDKLNSINWQEKHILRNGRHHFTQSILSDLLMN